MDVEGHGVIEGLSPTTFTPPSRDAALSPRLAQSPEPIIVEEELPAKDDKTFHLSENDAPSSHNLLSPNSNPSSSNDPCSDSPITSEEHISGWDSDLSELSDPSMDEGESEGDSSDSEPIPVSSPCFLLNPRAYRRDSSPVVSRSAFLPGDDGQMVTSRDAPSGIVKRSYRLIIGGSVASLVGHITANIKGTAWGYKGNAPKTILPPRTGITRLLSVYYICLCRVLS
jgi:hypothetical protein